MRVCNCAATALLLAYAIMFSSLKSKLKPGASSEQSIASTSAVPLPTGKVKCVLVHHVELGAATRELTSGGASSVGYFVNWGIYARYARFVTS